MYIKNIILIINGDVGGNFNAAMRFHGRNLLWLVMGLLLFFSSLRTIATEDITTNPPAAATPLSAILKTCQSKGHCPPYDLALLSHKHINEWTCLKDYCGVKTDEKRYQLINGYLTIAAQLLQSKDSMQQQSGIFIAWESAKCAAKLREAQMSDKICTMFLLPNIEKFPSGANSFFSLDNIASSLVIIYSAAKDDENLARAYKQLLASHCCDRVKDGLRIEYAASLADHANYKHAIAILHDIKYPAIRVTLPPLLSDYTRKLAAQAKSTAKDVVK